MMKLDIIFKSVDSLRVRVEGNNAKERKARAEDIKSYILKELEYPYHSELYNKDISILWNSRDKFHIDFSAEPIKTTGVI